MARQENRPPHETPLCGFRIEAPRVSDAIGLALRDAYERDLGLPDDMAAMLRRLNGGFTRTAG